MKLYLEVLPRRSGVKEQVYPDQQWGKPLNTHKGAKTFMKKILFISIIIYHTVSFII